MKMNFSNWRAALGSATVAAFSAVALNLNADQSPPTPAPAAPTVNSADSAQFPIGVADVVHQWHLGLKPAALISFVNDTAVPYKLTADQLAQLRATGLPPEVIQAIVLRGAQLEQQKEVPPPPPSVILAYGGAGDVGYGAPYYPYDYAYYGYPFYDWPYYFGPWYGYGFYGHGYHGYGYHGGHFGNGGFHGGFHGGGGGGGRR
jgi:hypothetical protein